MVIKTGYYYALLLTPIVNPYYNPYYTHYYITTISPLLLTIYLTHYSNQFSTIVDLHVTSPLSKGHVCVFGLQETACADAAGGCGDLHSTQLDGQQGEVVICFLG